MGARQPLTKLRTQTHPKIISYGSHGRSNGFLVPIYNVHDGFFGPDRLPQQAYVTSVAPGEVKGPHLHFIRTGFFTCIKGNVRIVTKTADGYQCYLSGEDHDYLSVEIPTGVPAAIQNIGAVEALILNLPCPAWDPEMADEHTANFDDFDFDA